MKRHRLQEKNKKEKKRKVAEPKPATWVDHENRRWNQGREDELIQHICETHLLNDLTRIVMDYYSVPEYQLFARELPLYSSEINSYFSPFDDSVLFNIMNTESVVQISHLISGATTIVQFSDKEKDPVWTLCHGAWNAEHGDGDVIQRVHDLCVVEDFQRHEWKEIFRAVFNRWRPDFLACSVEGEVVVFWQEIHKNVQQILVMKRTPQPHVIGSFRVAEKSMDWDSIACDWCEVMQRGLLVLLHHDSRMLYCWSLPQETPSETCIHSEILTDKMVLSQFEDRFFYRPQVSIRSRVVVVESQVDSRAHRIGDRLVQFLVLRVPASFVFL